MSSTASSLTFLKDLPDTGIEIRNKLEHLSGDDRLSVDAISGIDEKIKKAKGSGVSGIVAHRLDQIGDVDMVTTPPSDGQVLAYDAVNTKWVPSSAGAGTGDVTKVGTPVNNQVGVWTGNGTLEGDTALTFDTTTDTLAIAASGKLNFGAINVLTDTAGTTTLANIDALDATTEATIEAAIDTLDNLTTAIALGTVKNTLTGVLRADSGVLSVDADVTDIVAAGTEIAAGKLELATNAETVTGTDTARATTPANIAAKMAAPGAIGGTTPSTGKFTTIETTGNIELGAASDTTLARVSAGVVSIEGNNILTSATGLPLAGGTMTGSITLGENTGIALDPAGSADGKWSGITIAGTAGYAQSFGDLVYLAVADSRWEKTDADASATGGPVLIGMVVSAGAADGNACTILLQGQIRADAKFPALTIGAPVYLGEAAGEIQTAIPTGADNVIRVVGFALTADEIYFNPSQDHQLSVA
jgi:hypothetical protein